MKNRQKDITEQTFYISLEGQKIWSFVAATEGMFKKEKRNRAPKQAKMTHLYSLLFRLRRSL